MKALLCLFLMLPSGAHASAQKDAEFIDKTLAQCFQAYARLRDYTCSLSRKELLKGTVREQNNVLFKFKKPEHYYFKVTEGLSRGVQLALVKGRNDDKILLRLGFPLQFVKLRLDAKSPILTSRGRHPLEHADIGHILQVINDNYQRAKQHKEGGMALGGEDTLDGRKVLVFNAEFPRDKGYYGSKIRLRIDKELTLPVMITVYGWAGELLESYVLSRCQIDPGLTEKDFEL